MKRNPEDSGWFISTEVEHSPYKGLKTLFIVGGFDPSEMKQVYAENNCQHTYLAANQSFLYVDPHKWVRLAEDMLKVGPVTIDIPVLHLPLFVFPPRFQRPLMLPEKVHIMLSVYAPGINRIGSYTVKLDDDVTSVANPGVWCIDKATAESNFTPWSAYSADSELNCK